MLRNLVFGQYVHKDSLVHKIDPRIKILAVLFLFKRATWHRHFNCMALCFTGSYSVYINIFHDNKQPGSWAGEDFISIKGRWGKHQDFCLIDFNNNKVHTRVFYEGYEANGLRLIQAWKLKKNKAHKNLHHVSA